MRPILTTSLWALLLMISWGPVEAQSRCVAERVSLLLPSGDTFVLETVHDICSVWNGKVELRHYQTQALLASGVVSENYKICIILWDKGLWDTANANASKPLKEQIWILQKQYTILTDTCLVDAQRKGLNFPLPTDVISSPFPPNTGKEGVILFHLLKSGTKATLIEGWNFVLGTNGYYLEHPISKWILLEGDEKLKRFIELFDKKITISPTPTSPLQIVNLIVSTANEIR